MSDTIGTTTVARSLRELQLARRYLTGQGPKEWHAEQFSDREGSALDPIRHQVDVRNSQDRAAFLRWENQELHTLRRDRLYGSRSRKFLFTRGWQTKLLRHQEEWLLFAKYHSFLQQQTGYLDQLLKTDPLALLDKPFEEVLKLTTP